MIKTSPVKQFPGTVTLPDFLTLPQAMAFESAVNEIKLIDRQNATTAHYNAPMLTAILEIVVEWNIYRVPDRPTVENFPATPRGASAKFLSWLWLEIKNLYADDVEIPNA